jgi:hypothetical protein
MVQRKFGACNLKARLLNFARCAAAILFGTAGRARKRIQETGGVCVYARVSPEHVISRVRFRLGAASGARLVPIAIVLRVCVRQKAEMRGHRATTSRARGPEPCAHSQPAAHLARPCCTVRLGAIIIARGAVLREGADRSERRRTGDHTGRRGTAMANVIETYSRQDICKSTPSRRRGRARDAPCAVPIQSTLRCEHAATLTRTALARCDCAACDPLPLPLQVAWPSCSCTHARLDLPSVESHLPAVVYGAGGVGDETRLLE